MRPNTIRGFAAGIVTGATITTTIVFAAPAKADVPTPVITQYSDAVCSTLDDYPTFNGILGVGQALHDYGWTWREAGEIVGMAVLRYCPRHTQLLNDFMNANLPATATA